MENNFIHKFHTYYDDDKELMEGNVNNPTQEISIDEIASLDDFDPTEIFNDMKQKNISYFSSLSEEDSLDLARAKTKVTYDFFTKNRKNFSNEANQLMERIKRGHIPNDMEIRILLWEEKYLTDEYLKDYLTDEQIVSKKEMDEIQQRVSNGKIDTKDFNKLVEIMGFDADYANILKQAFSLKGILVDSYENTNDMNQKSR